MSKFNIANANLKFGNHLDSYSIVKYWIIGQNKKQHATFEQICEQI